MRKLLTASITLALVVFGLTVSGANDRDEAIMTVQVSSADHEIQEAISRWEIAPPLSPSPVPTCTSSWSVSAAGRSRSCSARPAAPSSHGSSGRGPENASSFLITCPTILLGVDAPAVRPTLSGPDAGSQRSVVSSRPTVVEGAPTGR